MPSSLQVLNKISQLSGPQRKDVVALIESLAWGSAASTSGLCQVATRRLDPGYVQGWSVAAGAEAREFARFFRGGVSHLLLPRVSLAVLRNSADSLIFSAMFLGDFAMETWVRSDRIETFYIFQGHAELVLPGRRGGSRLRLNAGEASQLSQGQAYRLFSASGTFAVGIQALPKSCSQVAAGVTKREPVKSRAQAGTFGREANEGRGPGAA